MAATEKFELGDVEAQDDNSVQRVEQNSSKTKASQQRKTSQDLESEIDSIRGKSETEISNQEESALDDLKNLSIRNDQDVPVEYQNDSGEEDTSEDVLKEKEARTKEEEEHMADTKEKEDVSQISDDENTVPGLNSSDTDREDDAEVDGEESEENGEEEEEYSEPEELANLTDEELQQLIDKSQEEFEFLDTENQLILNFLEHKDPEFHQEVLAKLDRLPKTPDDIPMTGGSITGSYIFQRTSLVGERSIHSNRTTSVFSQRSRYGSTRTMSSTDGQQIADRFKVDLVERELDRLKTITKEKELEATRTIATLDNELEELQTTNTELLDRMDRFDTEVMVAGIDPITKRVPGDKLIKFIEDEVKNDTKLVGKLRLRSSSLQQHLMSLKKQLTQKEQLSAILRPIDFEQMVIEKSRLLKDLEQKNRALQGLRKVSGQVALACAQQKKSLISKSLKIKSKETKIKAIRQTTERLRTEEKQVRKEIQNLDEKTELLQEKMKRYKAPSVEEYILQQKERRDLEQQSKVLKRRYDLQQAKLMNLQ